MAMPAYLWLKDDGGTHIKGSVNVLDREGSIEILGFGHGLVLPTDSSTGKITGTRKHLALIFEKEFDAASPYLYKAVVTGQTLISAEIKWYHINHAGQEEEYFNMLLEGVRVTAVCPLMHDCNNPATEKHNHLESVSLCYEKSPGSTATGTSFIQTHGMIDDQVHVQAEWSKPVDPELSGDRIFPCVFRLRGRYPQQSGCISHPGCRAAAHWPLLHSRKANRREAWIPQGSRFANIYRFRPYHLVCFIQGRRQH